VFSSKDLLSTDVEKCLINENVLALFSVNIYLSALVEKGDNNERDRAGRSGQESAFRVPPGSTVLAGRNPEGFRGNGRQVGFSRPGQNAWG
jgi:hypothetical protein